MDFIPWVEKYRPNNFNDIVLEDINKTIFNNIIETNYFPNLLFYGPPGTGKTTTIIKETEGIGKLIDDIILLLNKITKSNYSGDV